MIQIKSSVWINPKVKKCDNKKKTHSSPPPDLGAQLTHQRFMTPIKGSHQTLKHPQL